MGLIHIIESKNDHGGGKMVDINVVVANNIVDQMKKTNTKQIDLANAIGVTKQIMSKMLNGSRLISIAELRKIADYYHCAGRLKTY